MTNILRLILFLGLIPLAFAPALASEKPPIPGTRASQLDQRLRETGAILNLE